MKQTEKTILMVLLSAIVLVAGASNSLAQQPQAEAAPGVAADPIRDLNLSPEQRERIRSIREEMRDERAAINLRLRETNLALEELLDSDNPDNALVERRLHDVAEAQAASMRMRVLTELRVKRVLTPEQLATLRTLRQNARETRRERRQENNDLRRRDGLPRRGLPSRNTIAPAFPGQVDPNRKPRP
jgi:Spy/CpxP family protein refolding chaperone